MNFREKRMANFRAMLDRLPRPLSIIDVGGLAVFWRTHGVPKGCTIHLVNLMEQTDLPARVTSEVGSACELRQPSKTYDLAFSNSVIGHVGSFHAQMCMAREIRRVAEWYWVQTPNFWFPLDWQTLVPFFHWLPRPAQAWLHLRITVGRYTRTRDPHEAIRRSHEIHNLTFAQIQELFPDGEIQRERAFGFTKSFVVSRW